MKIKNILVGKTAPVDSEHGKCTDVVVARNDLIEKIDRIENLETRLNQQLAEHSFELEHARSMQSLELQKTCEKYENVIKQLNEKRKALELKYQEERNLINSAIDERNAEHSTTIIQIEAKLNEKILCEANNVSALKTKMNELKTEHEQQLRKSADCLKETIETLQSEFRAALNEREEQIRKLHDEIQIKKQEFFQYCNQLNLDNDRKVAQLKLGYETRQKETNDALLKWRTDASILTKKIESTSATCAHLRSDIAILQDEHNKNKKYISQLEQNITELQRDIDVRDKVVHDKEACLIEAIEKSQTMEKMKQFMYERSIQLEAQIKPLDERIKSGNCKIHEMEELKSKLLWKIDELNIEINLLRSRCKAISSDLKAERSKTLHSNTIIQRMCSDIWFLAQNIQDLPKLKELTLAMLKKYAVGL